jgi:DNA-binding transcriptional LysR family regulator
MYLPMELNSPLVIGALVAWLLKRSSRDTALAKARHDKGTLIASGFIAGGALVGVLAALLRFVEDSAGVSIVPDLSAAAFLGIGAWLQSWGNWLGLAVFLLLGAYVYWDSSRERPD